MDRDEAIKAELAADYEVVHVNFSRENRNAEVMRRLGNPEKVGFPALVVLSPQLVVLHIQESSALQLDEPGRIGHDPVRVLGFLRQWSAHPTG
jgi:hypothetical protein